MRTDIDLKSTVYRWTDNRFNMRASFYTGRDPSSSDLNSTILEQIYQGLVREVGQTEATNFAKFVARLNDLSASAFIQAFEKFWYGGCKDVTIVQAEGDSDKITGDNHADVVSEGFALFANALGGRPRMEANRTKSASYCIKEPFIRRHRKEIGKDFPSPPPSRYGFGRDSWSGS